MKEEYTDVWCSSLQDPSALRLNKPREQGITMVIDKGLGQHQFADFLQTCNGFVDYLKLGFGTSVLYPQPLLKEKISWAKQHEIRMYPGGTFFEIAFKQHKLEEYYSTLLSLGFQTVEISDGTIEISTTERKMAIGKAIDKGLQVITEYGKKIEGSTLHLQDMQMTLDHDLSAGATYMIIEGRESGINTGLYDEYGDIDQALFERMNDLPEALLEKIIWEAPQKKQQTELIHHFGTNINLGNIAPGEIYALEALRRGLRSDTFHLHL